MKHYPAARLAALACIAVSVALPALAETPDISGVWKFKTDVLPNKGCVISGRITFTQLPKPRGYACTFVSREDCKRESGDTFTEVKQSCIAVLKDGAFTIDSTVDQILDAGPQAFKDGMMRSYAYQPDSFVVKPSAKGDQLVGLFHSIRQAAVKFWRDADLVS